MNQAKTLRVYGWAVFRLWTLLIVGLVFACSQGAQTQAETQAETQDSPQTEPQLESPTSQAQKILILYLSRTHNTRAVAEMIQRQVGGTLVALELQTPYPENYQAIVQQVQSENERGYLPPLKTRIVDLETYDVVFLGFPTWGMQLPPPIKSFLTQYPLAGKTLLPFNTNAGYGIGSSFETIEKISPEANILEGFSVRGGIERDGVHLAITGARAVEVNQELSAWLLKVYRN